MEDIELVIKIPKEIYDYIHKHIVLRVCDGHTVAKVIATGTPLPKGHGRLIDADALNFNADYNEPLISKLDFDCAPTIIEADKAESEDKE